MSQQLTPEFPEIDSLLRSTASAMTYPATPNIAGRASAAIDDEAMAGGFWASPRLPLARAATAVLFAAVVAVAIALATPQSREALADFFGLSHVDVEIRPVLGPLPPVLSPESFAKPSTLVEAQRAVDFGLRLATTDGTPVRPDAVYLDGLDKALPVAILVYEDAGYDLYQTRRGFFGKGSVDEDLFQETSVGGQPALWIDEGGHIARSLDKEGRVLIETERTVERATLLWEIDGVTYRLETSLPEEEAIAVAESLE